MANTSNLSAINCKGRQVNLLNEDKEDKKKRKYHCTECQKSFTTRFVCCMQAWIKNWKNNMPPLVDT